MPGLEDLGVGEAEAEDEAVAGHGGEREGGHGGQGRGARTDLEDAGAEADALGAGGDVGEGGGAVEPPGLCRPERIDAEPFRFGGEEGGALPVVRGVGARVRRRSSWSVPAHLASVRLLGGVARGGLDGLDLSCVIDIVDALEEVPGLAVEVAEEGVGGLQLEGGRLG